jgi:AcrR family transcriptional regulator
MVRRTPPAPAPRETYHHGDLRAALIDATEALLAERGLEGFSLREVARRSGVSPAAPAHHFGDAHGLLAEVARLAFEGLTAALEAGNARGGSDALARLREQGIGYVDFAMRQPGRFGLMGQGELRKDTTLLQAANGTFGVLERGVRDFYGVPAGTPLSPAQWQALLGVWSVVHGYAHLALAGRFDLFAAGGQRRQLLQTVLPGLLQQHLEGLRAVAAAAPDAPRPAGRRRAR